MALNEQPHFMPYHDWGLVHPSGKIISGLAHPTAESHSELKEHVYWGLTDKERAEHPLDHYAEYADEHRQGMAFRTNNNVHSVGAALKGLKTLLKTLPSSTGEYQLDHVDGPYVMGPEKEIRRHLTILHNKLKNPPVEKTGVRTKSPVSVMA
jgi:hypothetical protein